VNDDLLVVLDSKAYALDGGAHVAEQEGIAIVRGTVDVDRFEQNTGGRDISHTTANEYPGKRLGTAQAQLHATYIFICSRREHDVGGRRCRHCPRWYR